MSTLNAPPSHDATSEDMLVGLLFESYKKFLQQTDDMLPARVISYDRATNIAVVQPMIMMLTTDNQRVERGTVSVPVFQFGGSGFFISFPLNPDDMGWIKASDRDIGLFLQSHQLSEPNTKRLHSFSDGMFYPMPMPYGAVGGEDSARAVFQTMDGATKITVGDNIITIKSSATVHIEASAIDIIGAVSITGTLDVTGNINCDADVFAGAISLKEHGHKDVKTGGDNSGKSVVI